MIYQLLNRLFGWDYVYWSNSADEGIARVHLINDGVFYWRYKNTKVLDEIIDIDQVVWLTCSPEKYQLYINKGRKPQGNRSAISYVFKALDENNRQLAELKRLVETNNAKRIRTMEGDDCFSR